MKPESTNLEKSMLEDMVWDDLDDDEDNIRGKRPRVDYFRIFKFYFCLLSVGILYFKYCYAIMQYV